MMGTYCAEGVALLPPDMGWWFTTPDSTENSITNRYPDSTAPSRAIVRPIPQTHAQGQYNSRPARLP